MQTISRSNFTTVTTEGAILPADLLQRIADGDVEGLAPTDYHLAPNERLNEAINRSWNRLLGVWEGFDEQRQRLPDHDRGTTLTRERWLLILFEELGYGRLSYVGHLSADQATSAADLPAPELRYPISHAQQHVPIHLITLRQSLDRVDDDRSANFRRSPHSLLQEFLNRSEHHLWGIVANGLRLRLLRDNASFTRAAYLEFDLEAMFEGDLYADFTLLWLICHQSRVEVVGSRELGIESGDDEPTPHAPPPMPADCWLERWSQQAAEQGTRALDGLRDGVTEAIARLGRGFLAHPANGDLRARLQQGDLHRQDYFRQLLRLVYRLIFLFVAEDRNLLLLPATPTAVRQQYMDHYSLLRLRQLAAKRRSGPHPDLYRGLRLVLAKLRDGYEPLGLPGLGGFLFSTRSTPALDEADIANEALLDAIRALTFTIEKGVRRPVDYKNLGSEELGSVYESLLELHPELNVHAATFDLRTAAGSERKTTGSYYTPTSLINSLLDSALEPVVAERLQAVRRGSKGVGSEGVGGPPYSPTPSLPHSRLEEAILSIKVVDPACGSGHFLIAAANRLARHLARIRTGDGEPSPAARRQALRDVVRHCIYGVDINEMSVELCRVALWLETLDPGKPLGFLEANIQCGNSLMGATPALLEEGIPDDAFKPITGDDKAYCREWKKRNKEQRKGQMELFRGDMQPWERLGDFANAMRRLETMADDTLDGVQAREAEYRRLVASGAYEYGKLWADAWCAAFVWLKRGEEGSKGVGSEGVGGTPTPSGWPYPITEEVFRNLERAPHREPQWLKDEIQRLAQVYQFFHWHLAFPQVFTPEEGSGGVGSEGVGGTPTPSRPHALTPTGWTGGFDAVLGNPPWERIKLQEKEWFASRDEEIATARNAAARRKLIRQLPQTNPDLYDAFQADKRRAEGESHFARNSGKYPLCGRGDINTYTIFAELARHIQSETGRAGVIVPSGIATDATTQYYFQDIMDSGALVSLYDFENRAGLFPAVDGRMKFCLLTLIGPRQPSTAASFIFFALDVTNLRDADRRFTLSADDIALLNPNTRTCPIFRSKRDAELTKAIYWRMPVLIKEGPPEENPWNVNFLRMFDMSNDSELFRSHLDLEASEWQLQENFFTRGEDKRSMYLPLYESKMFAAYDHRFANIDFDESREFRKGQPQETSSEDHLNAYFHPQPQWYVPSSDVKAKLSNYPYDWFLVVKRITSATNWRTMVGTVLEQAGASDSITCFLSDLHPRLLLNLLANLNSFVFDFATRMKMGATTLNQFIVKQLPVLQPKSYEQAVSDFLGQRILELLFTSWQLRRMASDIGYHGPPFRWDEERRFLLRCELDAAYFHLYGIERDDVAYIMDTFPIVRRKDEAAHGEYRTKRVILEIYDEMAAAIAVAADSHPRSSARLGNRGYITRLDPPPAHPDAAHPWDEAHLGPELPRDQWWREEVKSEEVRSEGVNSKEVKESGTPYSLSSTPLTLTAPPPPKPKTKPAPSLTAQPALLTDFSPLKGNRIQRLKAVMGMGQPKNQAELQALVGALADEDDNIRWLATSFLTQIGGTAVVNMLAAFLQTNPGNTARQEAVKVLGLIGDMSEDEGMQAAAMAIINERSS